MPENEITPIVALENLAKVAELHLLNGPDRRAINLSLQTLDKVVKEYESNRTSKVDPIKAKS